MGKNISYLGVFLGLLYLLLGVTVIIGELGASNSQVGGLGYLVYLLPWSFFLWDPWISHENILVMLIATALNTLILYFLGKGIGLIFLKLKMLFKRV